MATFTMKIGTPFERSMLELKARHYQKQGLIHICERETKVQISFIISVAFIVSRRQIKSFISRFVSRPIFLAYRFADTNFKSKTYDKRKTERETNEIYRPLRLSLEFR